MFGTRPSLFSATLVTALSSAAATPALAHPGHDHAAAGVMHLAMDLASGELIAIVLGLGALAWVWPRSPKQAPAVARKPSRDDRKL